MMKMASGDGIPLRQGAGTGSRLVLVATEACGGETPDLSSVLEVLGYVGIYGCRENVGGATEAPRGRGARPGGRARPHPCGQGVGPLVLILSPVFFIFSKKCLREFSGHSENFCFLHMKQHHSSSAENSVSPV